MGVTVNVAEWEAVKRQVEKAARGEFVPELAVRIAATATKLLADEFRLSRDPYGNPWLPVYRRRRRDRLARARRAAKGLAPRADKPLVDTGRLRAAATGTGAAQPSGSGVRIRIPVSYAGFHQDGTRTVPRRQIVPDDKTGGLGPIWTAAINSEADKVLRQIGKL